jgi:glycine dehydrogenase subunit 2
MAEPLIYDVSEPGRCGVRLPEPDVPLADLPAGLVREDLNLPEVSELDVVRHFTRLSTLNHSIDRGFYPLGSCTMKYNPRINEETARLPGFVGTHPLQQEETVQGNLYLMYTLQEWLKEIGGFAGVTLQPAAGAHGEFTGILMMRAYHLDRGDTRRTKVLIPDSAHGTNPASTTMSGLQTVEVPSDDRGNVDLAALRELCDDTVVGLMITNPNTLGLFEEHIREVVDLIQGCGGLIYGDGANMNALLGVVRPGDLGFDVLHYNLGVSERMVPYLPGPIVEAVESGDDEIPFYRLVIPPKSIGRMKAFHGHFGIFVRAYTYIRMHGAEGLRRVAEHAVLNANYLQAKIGQSYPIPFGGRRCMHEFVAEGVVEGSDVRALDISKRLMDYGFHPPTNYFPLIVHEALMIEPTETESKQTLDAFAEAMARIKEEAQEDPELLHAAPHDTPVARLDEVKAARDLVLCCWVKPG